MPTITSYKSLRELYLLETVDSNGVLRDGSMLTRTRRKTRPAQIDRNEVGFRALKQRIGELQKSSSSHRRGTKKGEVTEEEVEIFRMLWLVRKWEKVHENEQVLVVIDDEGENEACSALDHFILEVVLGEKNHFADGLETATGRVALGNVNSNGTPTRRGGPPAQQPFKRDSSRGKDDATSHIDKGPSKNEARPPHITPLSERPDQRPVVNETNKQTPTPVAQKDKSTTAEHSEQRAQETQPTEASDKTPYHFFVGRNFCIPWIDAKGRQVIVYGIVTELVKNAESNKTPSFLVTFNAKSRNEINPMCIGGGTELPKTQTLKAPLVIGGCVRFEKDWNTTNACGCLNDVAIPPHWSFVNQSTRREDTVATPGGKHMPRLTLITRGFHLELNVKQSTILTAGNGVFLKCTPLFAHGGNSKSEPFVLKAGELVDLGRFGPFRIEDIKPEAVFDAKNVAHSHKCEEWAFNSNDKRYQVDMTDDVTGDIGAEAKSHIMAFVNESAESFCITAEHSPDGGVNYWLGHTYEDQGDLVVPTDCSEMEVFTNYGSHYEKVRVRKGYGWDEEREAELKEELEEQDVSDVLDMFELEAADVSACVSFFCNLVSGDDTFTQAFLRKALLCAVVLQRRARKISGAGDKKKGLMVLAESKHLIKLLLDRHEAEDVLELQALHAIDRWEELHSKVLKAHFSDEDLQKKLADVARSRGVAS